jgi:hypothetical protein
MPLGSLYYQIHHGLIRVNRNSPAEHRFWSRVNKEGPLHPHLGRCWVWLASVGTHGYGQLSVGGRPATVHTYSWKLHRGPTPNELYVLHSCDIKLCVNPSHLFLGTFQDNMDDRDGKGRQPFGEKNGQAILTDQIVIELRRRYCPYSRTDGCAAMAKDLGLAGSTVREAIKGIKWRHLK